MKSLPGDQLFGRYYVITPHQFARLWGRNLVHMSGYQRFYLAQIQDAFNDALQPEGDTDHHRAVDRQLAMDWFRGTVPGRISFTMCCAGLDINEDWLRRGIFRMLHNPQLHLHFKRRSVSTSPDPRSPENQENKTVVEDGVLRRTSPAADPEGNGGGAAGKPGDPEPDGEA